MFKRRSVKSSSLENEGAGFQTPTKMSDPRQPLRDMLLQNSVSRGLRKLDVDVSGLTPILKKLHLQSEVPSTPTLVYEDVFADQLLKSAVRTRGLTPLGARVVFKSRASARPMRAETPSLIREDVEVSSVPPVHAPPGNAVQPEDSMPGTEAEVETVPGRDRLDGGDTLPEVGSSPSPRVAAAIPASPQPDRTVDTPQQPCHEPLADSVPQTDTNRDEEQLMKAQTPVVSLSQPEVESLESPNRAVAANSAVRYPKVGLSPVPRMDVEREVSAKGDAERLESSPGMWEPSDDALVTSAEVHRDTGEDCDVNVNTETLPVLRSLSFSVEPEAGGVCQSPEPQIDIPSSTLLRSPRGLETMCAFQGPRPQTEEEGSPGVEVGTSPLPGLGVEMTNLVDDTSEEVTSPVADASEEVTDMVDDVGDEGIKLVTDAIEEMTSPVADADEKVTNQLDDGEEVKIPATGVRVEDTGCLSGPGEEEEEEEEEVSSLLPGTSVVEITRLPTEANAEKDVSSLPGVEVGTSPMLPMPTCALMCLVHPEGFRTPAPMDAMADWRLLGAELIRSRVCVREASTAITPIGTQCAESGMTPLSLADKSMNTSLPGEVRQSQLVDSATLTDSLLWSVSSKDLDSVPREALERRVETALLMNDVLCSQLNDLARSKGVGLRVGPSDLREIFTQTDSTQAPEVEQEYRDLYLLALGRLRDLEMSLEQYQRLRNFICQNREEQSRAVQEVEETSENMASAYEEVKKERVKLRQQTQEMRQLMKSSSEALDAMRERTRCAFREHAQMKQKMETALTEKEAVDQCCRVLSESSADHIARLELDLLTWKDLCESLRQAGAEQSAWCVEFESAMDGVGLKHHAVVEKQLKLRLQLKAAGDLAHHSSAQLQALNTRAQASLEERAALRSRAEEAECQRDTVQWKLDHTAKELGDTQEQLQGLNSEKLQLQSELQSRCDQLTELGAERDKLMNDNTKYFVEVATTEASLKLLEVTLAEKMEKLLASEAHNKKLEDTIKENAQSWEKTLSGLKREKEIGERLASEYQEQLAHIGETLRENQKKLYELSEVQAQLTVLSETTEFMEQEVKVSRELLTETEASLSSQVDLLHRRDLECEELRANRNILHLELKKVEQDAGQMRRALAQVSALKDQTRAFIQAAESRAEAAHDQLPSAGQSSLVNMSLVCDILQAAASRPEPEGHQSSKDRRGDNISCGFKSRKSVFAPIDPITPMKLDNPDTWTQRVEELGEAVSDLIDVASLTEREYQQQSHALLEEIADMKAQRKAMYSNCDALTDKVTDLKIQNNRKSQDLQSRDKTIEEQEKIIATQNGTILYLNQQMETNFKEHTRGLALQSEVMELKRSLQRAQVETDTFREEMVKLRASGTTPDVDWLQDKVELRHQVSKLRDKVLQHENTIQQMSRHRNTLEENSRKSERELVILDDLIENTRTTLLSVPHTVAGCQELRSLLHLLRED